MITLKSLLHLRQKVITFRTLLHLGSFITDLGLLQHLSCSTPAEGSTSYAIKLFSSSGHTLQHGLFTYQVTCYQDFKGVVSILNSIDVTR